MSGTGFGRGPLAAGEEHIGSSRPVGAALPLLRRAARFFLPYQGRLALIGTLIAASSVIGLANPYLLKLMIDDAFPKGDIGLLGLYAALMVIVPIINGGIGLAQSWMTASVGQFVMRDLRNLLFTHVQSMPIRFFSETRTGEIQSRLTNDVSGVQSVVSDAAANLASSVAIVLSTLVAMALIDWRLTAVSLCVAPLFLYFSSRASAARRSAACLACLAACFCLHHVLGETRVAAQFLTEALTPATLNKPVGSFASKGWFAT